MATRTSLKNTPALSNYLRHAPIASIHQLCDMAATKDRLRELATLDWPEPLDERCRGHISRAIAAFPQEVLDRLNDYANQILDLSRNDAAASMRMAEEKAYEHNPEGIALLEVLDDQPDAIGRATALLVLAPKLFDLTQRHFYSYYYRGGTQNYRNFEITPNGQAPEVHWNDEICQKLEPALQACLGLTMPCRVEHLEIERRGEDDKITLEHHFVIRHAGEKSSVTHIVDEELNTEPLYYQPPIEAVVIVLPSANRVEVFNRDKALSVDLASVVVSIVVSSALSERPVSLRQYNLSRFYESLTLPQDVLNDLSGVERAVITEVEFQPDNHKRRLNIKVGSDDDIEEALDGMLGVDSPLRTGQYAIAKVVINMVISVQNKPRTINVSIRTPNNSNLAGLKDPTHRALATEVFKRYGLLEDINPPAHDQLDQALFDALLRLYESGDQRVYQSKLHDWGVSEQQLLQRGFLTASTPASSVPITDPDGNVTLLKVQGVGQNLFVTDPITEERIQISPEQTVRYAIDHNWVLETLQKSLASALKPYPSSQPEDTCWRRSRSAVIRRH